MQFLRKASNTAKQVVSNIGEDLKQLGVLLYRLEAGMREKIFVANGHEALLVLLDGTINFHMDGLHIDISRDNVFEALPEAVFLPMGKYWEMNIEVHRSARFVVCEASPSFASKYTTDLRPYQIRKSDIECFERGSGQFQRLVRNITTDKVPTASLICGETLNPPGNWSSYPPHKHDTSIPDIESAHEEIYVFSVSPNGGWGHQEIYSPERNLYDIYRVEQDDSVLIPFGYHPVAAAPGYNLHYFWVLAGNTRKLMMHDDPSHAWIHSLAK